MAEQKKASRKKFRVAVSGPTADGRDISAADLRAAADSFNPEIYGARVNVEHWLSPVPSSEFSAMGDVISLSAEDITDGALAGRTALYAEIEPTDRMKKLVSEGRKIYSSIELARNFTPTGTPYLVGLAMTDTPASIGTERLEFALQQRRSVMTFNNQQTEAPLFSDAIEAEVIELTERRSEEGAQWFNRVMNMIGHGRKADDTRFSRIHDAVEEMAASHTDLLDRFSALEARHQADRQRITALSDELNELKTRLGTQDSDTSTRFTATGGDGAQLADY